MASLGPDSRLQQLWQFPLLLLSVGLFAVAAYLFIDPKAGPTIDDKIHVARQLLNASRPEAALEQLNKLLMTEKMDPPHQGQVHLMLAESLHAAQKHLKVSIPRNHRQIIEQTRAAVARGIHLEAPDFRRMGESFEALNRPTDALENYRKAISLDAEQAVFLRRKVIELQLDQEDFGPAEASLDEYLEQRNLSDSERSWALGLKAQMLIDQGKYIDARILLDESLRLARDTAAQGEVNYRLGYCAYRLNDLAEAERYLRVSRDQLQVGHPLDADACYLLGKIFQDRNDPTTANSYYQVVLTTHIDSKVMPLAMLGRGLCRIMLRQEEAGLSDLHDLVNEISRKTSRARLRDTAIEGLRTASSLLAARENYQAALEVLDAEHMLEAAPRAEFFERLGAVYERRAEQLDRTLATLPPLDRTKQEMQVRKLRTNAGDAYVAYSNKLTLTDDTGYGDAMWHGIDLYDRAAAVHHVILALETFTAERPDDRLAPDATLRLGRAYQAAGLFDKAIASYQRIQFRYPQSLARSKSAVPLAQAYIAKGPEHYGKAENVLLSVINDNPRLEPDAEEFKQSLFDLAQLYYSTRRFEEAVTKLEEFVQRYPSDPRMGQLLFLMADSYRKSAGLLEVRLASATITPPANDPAAAANADVAEATLARRQRLEKARVLFGRVIDLYRTQQPKLEVERLYLKHAYFYRADCMYDLGSYREAIALYSDAAYRYREDPSALAAYVQMVNAHCAMGQFEEARTTNERAKILLGLIPPEKFDQAMPKAYWQELLQWTSASGMW